MSNSVDSPTSRPVEVGLEARDEPLLAEDQGHPLSRAALERQAVASPDERDHGVVAVLRPAVLDRGQRRVLVAQLLEHLVDPGVVDDVDLGAEVEAACSRPGSTSGRTWTVALKMSGLPSSAWTTSTSALVSGQDVLARRAPRDRRPGRDGRRHRRGSRRAPSWRSRTGRGALPGRNPGTRVRRDEMADGLLDRLVEALGRDLDLEVKGGLWAGGAGDLHRSGSIGRRLARGRRRRPW